MDQDRPGVIVSRPGRDLSVSQGTDVDHPEVDASRRLAEVFDSSVIDALVAGAQATGTPVMVLMVC